MIGFVVALVAVIVIAVLTIVIVVVLMRRKQRKNSMGTVNRRAMSNPNYEECELLAYVCAYTDSLGVC